MERVRDRLAGWHDKPPSDVHVAGIQSFFKALQAIRAKHGWVAFPEHPLSFLLHSLIPIPAFLPSCLPASLPPCLPASLALIPMQPCWQVMCLTSTSLRSLDSEWL